MTDFHTVLAVVLAAGNSTRMGGGENKIIRLLGNRPVLAYSLEQLQRNPRVTHVVVTGRRDDFPVLEEVIRTVCPKAAGHLTEGGKERFDSVLRGLEYGTRFHPDAVLIHDSARPFLEDRYIQSSLDLLMDVPGCIIGVPLKDSLKEITVGGVVQKTHERSKFWLSQTPQTFRFKEILAAYRAYSPPPYPTDDGAVLECQGGLVKMVEGAYLNIKLTAPEDWILANAILQLKRLAQ